MNPAIEEQLATNLYYDRTFDCEAAKILPGEYYFTNQPMLIVTVLGSCVAACIRDKVSGIGGMNHFMLPDGGAVNLNGFNTKLPRRALNAHGYLPPIGDQQS